MTRTHRNMSSLMHKILPLSSCTAGTIPPMRTRRTSLITVLLISSLVLLGTFWARKPEQPTMTTPAMTFIGIGSGSLTSNLRAFVPQERISVSQRSVIGVVQFRGVPDGSSITASWFSPDDRSPPIGRSTATVSQGAQAARFLFATQHDWPPAPYQLHIDIQMGEKSVVRTLSGSTRFFIGLSDAQIREYMISLPNDASSSAAGTSPRQPAPAARR